MARINFISLKCVRKQDVVGDDEPEIWVSGAQRWKGVMHKGEIENLKPMFAEFADEVEVKLIERNPNSAKTLGTIVVRDGNPHAQPVDFKTSGAHYELTYTLS